jgi:diphthamide biosynthesis enzyme Dph1/Dph2-like protein
MEYNLELVNLAKEINKEKAKLVCLQLPDGLKPQATKITKFLEENTKAKIVIWLGSCWGACDTPIGLNNLKFDLIIQYGHSAWPFY